MLNITNRFRKILRTVFRGIGVSVVSLILQACYGVIYPDDTGNGQGGAYGMPPPAYGMPPNTYIFGKVTASNTGDPIFGIKVSSEENDDWEYTDKYGKFNFSLPVQETYKIKFEDVDGPYHGGFFKEKSLTLKDEDANNFMLIVMDIDTETDEE